MRLFRNYILLLRIYYLLNRKTKKVKEKKKKKKKNGTQSNHLSLIDTVRTVSNDYYKPD